MSKILEKSVHTQVSEINMLYENQSGFRKGFSTNTCLTQLTDYIKIKSSEGLYTGIALLDVQKAFDSVSPDILCTKLHHMGIQPDWFRSYLTNRNQIVMVNDCTSDTQTITCGIPQGSILGPLLSLCFMNDMSICISSKCKVLLYADDSFLMVSDKNPDMI